MEFFGAGQAVHERDAGDARFAVFNYTPLLGGQAGAAH